MIHEHWRTIRMAILRKSLLHQREKGEGGEEEVKRREEKGEQMMKILCL